MYYIDLQLYVVLEYYIVHVKRAAVHALDVNELRSKLDVDSYR